MQKSLRKFTQIQLLYILPLVKIMELAHFENVPQYWIIA